MRHVHDRAHRDPASRTVLHRCKSPWTHRARLGGSEHTGEVPGHHRDSMLQMRICTTPAGLPNTPSSREPSASCHHGSIMQRCMAWQASTLLALALTVMLQPMPDSTSSWASSHAAQMQRSIGNVQAEPLNKHLCLAE